MLLYKSQIDYINLHLAATLRKLTRIVDVIARLCVIIAIYELEEIPCDQYDVSSQTREHHDENIASEIAVNMNRIIVEEIQRMLIGNDVSLDALLNEEIKGIGTNEDSQRFKGFVVGRKVVDRMKKDMKVACPYLHSVDKKKKKGTINFCFVYSCYETNNDGTEIIAPQKIGGISLEVDLPMTKSTIRNPLFSSRGSEYWMNTWLNRVALWSTPIICVAELALDARIFRNNQGLEGCINHEKNHTSTTKEDMSCLSALIVKRWKDTIPAAKLLARQIRRSPHVIKKRKNLAYKKNSGVQTKERSMVWKKKKNDGSTKVALIRWKNKMEGAIIRAQRAGDIKLKSNKPFSKWNVMRDHANAMDASFMSSTTFYAWIEGRRDILLSRASEKVIDDLYYKYHETDEEPEDFTL